MVNVDSYLDRFIEGYVPLRADVSDLDLGLPVADKDARRSMYIDLLLQEDNPVQKRAFEHLAVANDNVAFFYERLSDDTKGFLPGVETALKKYLDWHEHIVAIHELDKQQFYNETKFIHPQGSKIHLAVDAITFGLAAILQGIFYKTQLPEIDKKFAKHYRRARTDAHNNLQEYIFD